MSTATVAASPTLRLAVVPRGLVADAVLVAAGVLLIAACAQIAIPLGFTPVPITGQTFAVLLVGSAYGANLGATTVLFYLLVGVVGAPVYSDGGSGWEVLSGTNAGYLFGFAIAAWIAGWLAQKRWDRRFSSAVAAMLTGQLVIYGCGLAWLGYELGTSFDETLELGLYPFVPGALLKIYLAAALLPGAWKLVSRLRRPGDD